MKARTTLVAALLAACYAACFVGLTYPLALHLGSCFASDAGAECEFAWERDSCIFVWNIYNFTESVRHLENPFVTHRIFHPVGTGLWWHVYAPACGLVGLLVGEPILALNLAVLLSFILSGLGAYLLANHYLGRKSLSALAGFAFAFCPYKLLHIRNHYDLMLTGAIPFFVLCVLRAFRGAAGGWPHLADRRYLVGAAGCLALTLLSCYYYVFFLAIFAVLYAAYWRLGLGDVDPLSRRALRRSAVAVIASTAVMNLLKLVLGLVDAKGLAVAENGLGGSSDLLAFLLPSASSRFLRSELVGHLRLEVLRTNPVESTVYVGYALLAFAVAYLAARQYRRETGDLRLPAFMTGAFLILAMPVLRVADRSLAATPSALLHFIPFISNFRAPYRYSVMVMLFLPIVSCLFVNRSVLPRLPKRARGPFILGLAILLLVEYAQEDYRLLCRADVPRVYEHLAAREKGALLEIPFGWRDGFGWRGDERTTQLFYQTVHGKPILAGVVSRAGEGLFSSVLADPVVSALITMQETRSAPEAVPAAPEVDRFLEAFAVRYVLVHPEYRGGPVEAWLEQALGGRISARREFDGFALLTVGAAPAVPGRSAHEPGPQCR